MWPRFFFCWLLRSQRMLAAASLPGCVLLFAVLTVVPIDFVLTGLLPLVLASYYVVPSINMSGTCIHFASSAMIGEFALAFFVFHSICFSFPRYCIQFVWVRNWRTNRMPS